MEYENKFQTTKIKIPTIRSKIGLTTINQMIEQSCSLYGEKTSFVKLSKNKILKYTYNDVFNYTTKMGRHLKELGIKKGDHIGIIGENCPEWAITYFAVSWIGAVAIPIDSKASADTIENILKLSKPTVIFFTSSLKKLIEKINDNLNTTKHLILMEGFETIYSKYSKGINNENLSSNDLIDILFTSGTTGNPKGVMLSHGNIMSNVEDVYSFLDINSTDRAFSILPIHHSYERTGGLLSTFYCGMSVYYGRGLKPREMLEDLRNTKPTVWLNTPLLLEKLYGRIRKELESQTGLKKIITTYLPRKIIGNKIKKQLGLDNIKLIVSGGAALPFWVSEGLSELGFNIIQGYGLSEASPLITANPPSNPKNQSVGMVIESDEVEIRDLDNDKNGEIYAKGPNIMKGYFENPTATEEVLTKDDWPKNWRYWLFR